MLPGASATPGRPVALAFLPADADEIFDYLSALMSGAGAGGGLRLARPAWMARGACRGAGIGFFDRSEAAVAVALAVCHSCPVRGECLAYALETDSTDGVWGGLTAKQRRTLTSRDRRRGGGPGARLKTCAVSPPGHGFGHGNGGS